MYTIRCLVNDESLDQTIFRAEHGLSLSIESPSGQILFDTGQSGDALVNNAVQLGIDLYQTDALVLSHAHYDHTGGLGAFLQYCRPGLPLYAHSDLFRRRYSIKGDQMSSIGMRLTEKDLAKYMIMNLSEKPLQISPGIWTTGEITERAEFEGRSVHHYIQTDQGMQSDPYRDDLSLILEAASGLIVICGCCHAGILNTLKHVRGMIDKDITAILGGIHLANVNGEILEYTITKICNINKQEIPYLYLNHCSGENALVAFRQAFDEKIRSFPAGSVLLFT